jgi:hypothetical protein
MSEGQKGGKSLSMSIFSAGKGHSRAMDSDQPGSKVCLFIHMCPATRGIPGERMKEKSEEDALQCRFYCSGMVRTTD